MNTALILMICSLLCFATDVLLGLFDGSSGKLRLVSLGLAFLVASFLFR